MYLRTTKRKNKDGSEVKYYQLAHNERDSKTKKPVAHIIHNFGRSDTLDKDVLVRLCKSIARICGVDVIENCQNPINKDFITSNACDIPNDMEIIKTVDLGPITVIESLWEKIGIGKTLRKITKSKKSKALYERALLAMTANRLCEPDSKLGVWDRWLSTVYLPSCSQLKLKNMYEAMDLLYKHKDTIEENIFYYTANLLNLSVDLIFYDTTTAVFSVDDYDLDDDDIRQRGRDKNGGFSVQVVVALAVTQDGIPVRCWVLPGNTTDVQTVKKVRTDLRGWNLGRALFVADAGMNSEKNRRELSKACGKYILATRMTSVSEIKNEVLSHRGKYKVISENLLAKQVVIGNGERRRRYILCYNPREAERQKKRRKEIIANLEQEISKHKDTKATAKWAIDLLASKRYKKYLKINNQNKICINRQIVKDSERFDGKWVLETNDDTITIEDAASGYKSLLIIERCFRSLKKTQIKLEPMFHWLDHRIESHIRICVLALLIERVAEIHLGKTWFQILQILKDLQATKFQTTSHTFYRRNKLNDSIIKFFKTLDIKEPNSILEIRSLSDSN
jgi:transposase